MNLYDQLKQMQDGGKKVVSIEYVMNQISGQKHPSNPIPFVNPHQVHSGDRRHVVTPQ